TIVESRALELFDLLRRRQFVERRGRRNTCPIRCEVSGGPVLEVKILGPSDREVIAGVRRFGIPLAVSIAEHLRESLFYESAAVLVWVAKQGQHTLPPRGIGGATISQSCDNCIVACVERRTRPMNDEQAVVNPLHASETVEDRPHVGAEGSRRGAGKPALVVERLPHRVVHGDQGL